MEVREPSAKYLRSAGYVHTELGVLPTDWRLTEIGQIAETSSGTTPPRSQYDRYFKGGVHAWVKTLDLNNAEILETDESVTDKAVEETSLRLFPEGSVLVAMYGGLRQIGRTGLLRLPAAVNQAITAIRPNPTTFCPEFLLFYLNHRVGHWQSVASSSRKDPNITGTDVRAFKLPLPEIDEQQKIAAALTDADAMIDSLEQLLTKKRQIKQGAMQELLTGKRRLRQAADWHDLRLGDVASLKARIGWQGLTTAEYRERGDHLLVTGTEFFGGRIRWDACHYVDQDRYDQDKNIQLAPGDVLVTKDGTIGKAALIDTLPMPATLNSGVFVIRPRNQAFHPGFFYYLLASTVFSSFLGQLSAGSTINHLYQKDFVHFKFRLPQDIEEQRAVFEVLKAIDSEIETLESHLTKARALKQAMAQVLLTGRIRLVEPSA